MEYKIKYGIVGYYLYFIMFYLIKKIKNHILFKNLIMLILEILFTRQSLMRVGLKKRNKIDFKQIYYLLEGLKGKGIINIIRIFRNIRKYKLTIVGTKKEMIDQSFIMKI